MVKDSNEANNFDDIMMLLRKYDIDNFDVIPIGNMVENFEYQIGGEAGVSDFVKGNIMARVRMTVLYAQANIHNSIVIGTCNKSELLTGYATKFGDGASDIEPLGDLYKTQVFQLAKKMGIPQSIIDKPPSAGLIPGQTDEEDLGMDYETLDEILKIWQTGKSTTKKKLDIDAKKIEHVNNLIKKNTHKRHPPPIPLIKPF